MMLNISKFISSLFGIGFLPFAPGTAAALVVFALAWFFPPRDYPLAHDLIVVVLFLCAFFLSRHIIKYEKHKDPSYIVLDEVLGASLVVFFLPPSLTAYVIAFFTFRFFDIFKIPPIGWVEKRLSNAWGIILDDIIAALYTVIIISLLNL